MKSAILAFLFLILALTITAQNFWEQTNGPYCGNIFSMTVSDSGYIYVGSARSGLYKSSNNGDLWIQISEGIENVQSETIYSISIDTNFVMYIATRYNQVYRSINYGENWIRKSNGLPRTYIWTTIVNKSGDVFALAFGSGIYRSMDQGDTWLQINSGIGNLTVTDLAVSSENLLFSSTVGGGIFRSSNNGDTWSPSNNGLPFLDCNNINVVKDSLMFTTLDDNNLFRSIDMGESWYQVGNGLEGQSVLRMDIDTVGNLFATTFEGGVFKSVDLGENWTPLNNGISYTLAKTIKVSQSSGIYIGTNGEGVMKSENSGENWYQTNTGILNSMVRDFAVTNVGILYAATSGGVFSTSDLGNKWEPILDGLEDREIRAIESNSAGKMFAGSWYDGLYILDENNTWNNVTDLANKSIRAISIDENDWIYAGSYGIGGAGIYRSTDDGNSWIQINNDLHTLEIHSVKDGLMFAGGSGQAHSGLFKSTDYGDNWEFCAFELYEITGITSDSMQNIYVITGEPDGVYMSSDYGTTWKSIGLDGSAKLSISTSEDGYLYVGTEWGVFRSSNLGADWEYLLDGMTNFYASALICIPDNKVFVGTLGGGVCVGPDSVTSVVVELPFVNGFSLSQNYPNPFNPVTSIQYAISSLPDGKAGRQLVTLKVYDILGREIATLVNEEKPAGEYEVEFNGTNLPSGIYFYRLKAGNFVETKKMVLIK